MRRSIPARGTMCCCAVVAVILARSSFADLCVPDTVVLEMDTCLVLDEVRVVDVVLRNASDFIIAGQFYFAFSTDTFVLLDTEVGDSPFVTPFVDTEPEPGLIDFTVAASPASPGTDQDTVMVRLTLLVIDDEGTPFVRFRSHHPPNTLVTPDGGSIHPHMVDAGADGRVDLGTLADFQNCVSGEGVAATSVCTCAFDTDGDSDVDLMDYQALHGALNGPDGGWTCDAP